MSDTVIKRPGNVTFVVVLTWILAIGNLIAAAYLLIGAFRTALAIELGMTASEMRLMGWVVLGLGILTILVALGLSRGVNAARVLVISLAVIHIAYAVWVLLTYSDVWTWYAIWEIILSLLLIALLTTKRASQFFGTR